MPTRIVPPFLALANCAFVVGRRAGLACEREQAAHRTDRQAEHRAATQELGAVHLAGQQLVDQVVLEWPGLIAAVILDPPRQFTIHRLPPCLLGSSA